MKFLLTSSGIRNTAIARVLQELAGKPLTDVVFLFIPTAANPEKDADEWLNEDIDNMKKQNFKSFDIVDVAAAPEQKWKELCMAADVICFGGGNQQYLARILNEIGMKEFLAPLLPTKVYMGISAGSMVSGQFFSPELLNVIYPEEPDPDELERPLGFLDFSFVPHLNSEWFTHVRKETLERLKSGFTTPVYSVDDETALKVVDGTISIVGSGDYWIFKK